MLRKQMLLVTVGLALASSACATHQINYKNPMVRADGVTHRADQSFIFWGLLGGTTVDLAQVCPAGVAQIQSEASFLDHVVSSLTGGLYSPMSVVVECAAGSTVGLVTGIAK